MSPARRTKPSKGGERAGVAVLVELRSGTEDARATAKAALREAGATGASVDDSYEPVAMSESGSVIVRCRLADERQIEALRRRPEVLEVWGDSEIAPFPGT
jgi:hypothetical protein